jgi:hypothetical protein
MEDCTLEGAPCVMYNLPYSREAALPLADPHSKDSRYRFLVVSISNRVTGGARLSPFKERHLNSLPAQVSEPESRGAHNSES